MRKILVVLVSLIFSQANSQENTAHNWYFGQNSGIDFSTGVPIAQTDGQITSREGTATVGDIDGNLLFYCDGENIYNRNHLLMQNGSGLMGHSSATQSSIIVPYPGNDSLFYVFTVDANGNHLQNGLRYSIVNMNLDGGLGGVTTDKNILLESTVTEKLTAVIHQNQLNVWVIAHKWDSDEFVAYEISPSGINTTPVISAIGSVHEGGYSAQSQFNGWGNALGYMKSNIQGTQIALAIFRMNKVELFDFNKATGELTNYQESLATYTDAYGVEFSPNGDYLYLSQLEGHLYQFNLNQATPLLDPVLISTTSGNYGAIQTAPNGKLYVVSEFSSHINSINNPNENGLNCNFESNALYLDGNTSSLGLPTLFYYKGFEFFTGSERDTSICEGDSVYFENNWQTEEGTYYDTTQSYLGWDSIINTHLTVLPVEEAPVITENAGVLSSSSATGNSWYFNGNEILGATSQQYQPFVDGMYQVSFENENGCLSFSEEYYFTITKSDEYTAKKISIYPNPFSDILLISNDGHYNLKIYDISGSLIYQEDNLVNNSEIEISSLKKGMYIIEISQEYKQKYRRIMNKE